MLVKLPSGHVRLAEHAVFWQRKYIHSSFQANMSEANELWTFL